MKDEAYFIEVDNNGCSKCKSGRTWLVIGPDGYGGSSSYENIEDAETLAEELNEAYLLGRASAKPPRKKRASLL